MRKHKSGLRDVSQLLLNDKVEVCLLGEEPHRHKTRDMINFSRAKVVEVTSPLEGLAGLSTHALDLVVIPLSENAPVEVHYAHLIRELYSKKCPILFIGSNQNDLVQQQHLSNVEYVDVKEWQKLKQA